MPEVPFDHAEFRRWWRQAEHTIASAERDRETGDFAWASFKAQQAAEYAVKALLRGLGRVAVGHSVLKLVADLQEAGFEVGEAVLHAARTVDRHYIPPRYPDAYAAGSPFEFYDAPAAEDAIKAAREIMAYVKEVTPPAPAAKSHPGKARRTRRAIKTS
ncbi:MAG: HEPN domain-containing protein [Thermoleophilia bacterium]|nr:HEPN domain-containing protein [Thermoleophilia bacterium]